jgi:very-short-patch-repair endonuclease
MTEWFEQAIARLAAPQWGYVTREQLLNLGLSADAIKWGVKTGRLIPVHAGVYAVGHVNGTPVARAMAAVLACGEGALLSHGSAASLWGYFKFWDEPFEVTVATSHRRRAGIKIHRSQILTWCDIDRQHGVPVTSPARTVLDVAPRLYDRRLRRVVSDGRIGPHLHLDDLADVLDRNPKHPGTKRLRWFVESPTGATRSGVEDDFLAFARRYGLPALVTNTLVHGHEVDVLFPRERVIVEIDTWPTHGLRSSFEGDRERDADLLAAGYPTVRVTEERLDQSPDVEARRLHAILHARRAA